MASTMPRRDLEDYIAGMPGVNAQVLSEANSRAAVMRSLIAPHSKSGRLLSSVSVERENAKDYSVGSDDPHVLSKNYGHTSKGGRWVEGIHFLEGTLHA